MTEQPMGFYKPGLTLDAPIAITLAAADWITFSNWLDAHDDDDMVTHLIRRIQNQVGEAVFDAAAVKAAHAKLHERQGGTLADILRGMGAQVGTVHIGPNGPEFIDTEVPDPADFTSGEVDGVEVWVIVCDTCGSRDEYPPYFTGPLTCEHDGPRHLAEIVKRPRKGDDDA